jgi:D-3-phosphoglycerate dehydrogenase
MLKILILEPEYFDSYAVKALESVGKVTAKRMDRKELMASIGEFDILVVRIETRLDAFMLSKAKKLKLIGSATTSLNHIDLGYAKDHGIKVLNLHGTHTIPTAEHALSLTLSLARNIPWAYESIREGKWERHKFIGIGLDGKTIGIVGLGRIGKRVATYAKSLGMNVIYYDPYVNSRIAQKTSLNSLLKKSDIISIHAALTDETLMMIGKKEFSNMKENALVINTARGLIIDNDALIKALKSKSIAGAAIDVFPNEPVSHMEKELLDYSKSAANLLLTPHLGASTREALHAAGMDIAKQIFREVRKVGSG